MSSTDSSSEASSFVSENEYLSECDEISETEGQASEKDVSASSDDDGYAWADDPVADDEWTEKYEEEMRQQEILKEMMLSRLDGSTQLLDW